MSTSKPYFACPVVMQSRADGHYDLLVAKRDGSIVVLPKYTLAIAKTVLVFQAEGEDVLRVVLAKEQEVLPAE